SCTLPLRCPISARSGWGCGSASDRRAYFFLIKCQIPCRPKSLNSRMVGDSQNGRGKVRDGVAGFSAALYLTGYYYTFIGVGQLVTAILLLIARTALLGAMLYFPIILNICVLTYAVRFEGTRVATLMSRWAPADPTCPQFPLVS